MTGLILPFRSFIALSGCDLSTGLTPPRSGICAPRADRKTLCVSARTRRLPECACFVDLIEPCGAIRLRRAAEAAQVRFRMLLCATRRVDEPHCCWHYVSRGPIIANVRLRPPAFVLPLHRNWDVIGVQLRRGHHAAPQRSHTSGRSNVLASARPVR
jgi:hypothetical protein